MASPSPLYAELLKLLAHHNTTVRHVESFLVGQAKKSMRTEEACRVLALVRFACRENAHPRRINRLIDRVVERTKVDAHSKSCREFVHLGNGRLQLLRKLYASNQLSLQLVHSVYHHHSMTPNRRFQWQAAINRVLCEHNAHPVALSGHLPQKKMDTVGDLTAALNDNDLFLLRQLYQDEYKELETIPASIRADFGVALYQKGHYDVMARLGNLQMGSHVEQLVKGCPFYGRSPETIVDKTHWIWLYLLQSVDGNAVNKADGRRAIDLLNDFIADNAWAGQFDAANQYLMASIPFYARLSAHPSSRVQYPGQES